MVTLDERVLYHEPIAQRLLSDAYRERLCQSRDLTLAGGAGSIASYVFPELHGGLPLLLGLTALGFIRMNAPSRALRTFYDSEEEILYKAPYPVLHASIPVKSEPHPTHAWYEESCSIIAVGEQAYDLIVEVEHSGSRFTSFLCKDRCSVRMSHAIHKGTCDLIMVGGGSRILDAY